MSSPRLAGGDPGEQCLVKTGGGRKTPGWVREDIGKGYTVSLGRPDSPPKYFGNSKVESARGPVRKPLARGSRLKAKRPARPVQQLAIPDDRDLKPANMSTELATVEPAQDRLVAWCASLRAVPKPIKPARSEAYKDWVKRWSCCNCARRGPSDPHHEGPHGLGQKTSDFYCVPLCRWCHSALTDSAEHLLPDPQLSRAAGKIVMQSRETSQAIMRSSKHELLVRALRRLPLQRQVEVLASALAQVAELASALDKPPESLT